MQFKYLTKCDFLINELVRGQPQCFSTKSFASYWFLNSHFGSNFCNFGSNFHSARGIFSPYVQVLGIYNVLRVLRRIKLRYFDFFWP